MEFSPNDLRYVVERLPRDVRSLLSAYPQQLFLGGGFIREVIAGNTPNDIDLFGPDASFVETVARDFAERQRQGSRFHKSHNACTVAEPGRLTVQFITRWTFDDPKKLMESFDFTICQAVVWRNGHKSNDAWRSCVGERFHLDLASRRLVYTNPIREEEAGGSMLRVIKFVRRGYSIQVTSLGDVIARVMRAYRPERVGGAMTDGGVIAGILREVDPSLVVDGFDVVEDGQPLEGFDA